MMHLLAWLWVGMIVFIVAGLFVFQCITSKKFRAMITELLLFVGGVIFIVLMTAWAIAEILAPTVAHK
jgi:hypothetical protein